MYPLPYLLARVWDVFFKTVGGMDAAVELTRMYLQRVLKKTSHTRPYRGERVVIRSL
jgi:hypothetical protein